MNADPHVSVDDFVRWIEILGFADTLAFESYGILPWEQMDVHLAEQIPWPDLPFEWDNDPEDAKMLAWIDRHNNGYDWGVHVMSSRGIRACHVLGELS
jgi:hypothetical protein